MEFSLREFRAEDFEVLWSIDQQCFPPGIAYPRRELAAYIKRRESFTLVAERPAGKARGVAGFIVAEASRRGVGHIITIDVLPDSRRGGLGSKLLAAAETRLRVRCDTVVLETAVDNIPALAFYKRHDYSVVKVVPRYYSTGVDAFVLEKQLDRPISLSTGR